MTKTLSKHIAILGGTGALGSGLALRWAQTGHQVTLGSRDGARAAEVATQLSQKVNRKITGTSNEEAAASAELVVITVPYASHEAIINSVQNHLTGKILIDVTVPLKPPKVRTVQLPEGGSVAKALQEKLGDSVKVVSAFQNVAATHLADLDHDIDCDVLVCGNDAEARAQVVELANDASMKAWHGGRIDNSAVAEALTSLLIFINGSYKIEGAGIRITGIPAST